MTGALEGGLTKSRPHDRTVQGAGSRQLCGRATANDRPACSRQLSGLSQLKNGSKFNIRRILL